MQVKTVFGVGCLLCGLLTGLPGQQASRGVPPKKSSSSSSPAKPGRLIRFTTHEGTWLSLDVSPDGRWVAFDLLGSIYVVGIKGGQAIPLTSGDGNDRQPVFSPDGKTVAFVSDRSGRSGLWLVSIQHKTLRLLANAPNNLQFPLWSRDGRSISVATNAHPPAILTYSVGNAPSNRELSDLHLQTQLVAGQFAELPDHSWLASVAESNRDSDAIWRFYLKRFRTSGGTPLKVIDDQIEGFNPAVSPDGTHVVFGARRDGKTWLKLLNLKTEQSSWLAGPVANDEAAFSHGELLPRYAFTPDGAEVVLSYGGKLWQVNISDGHSTEIPFTATVERRFDPITRFDHPLNDRNVHVRQLNDARISPDGKHLIFSALERLYEMDLPNGKPHRLTTDAANEFSPTWASDSKTVAYGYWDGRQGGVRTISIVGDASKTAIRLSEPGFLYDNLAFVPNSDSIVAIRKERRPHWFAPYSESLGDSLVIIEKDQANFRSIGSVPNTELGHVHFSASRPSEALLYREGDGLYGYSLDGSKLTKLTGRIRGVGEEGYGDVQLAPDGKHIAIGGYNALTVAEISLKPTLVSAGTKATRTIARIENPVRISEMAGASPTWNRDGSSISYSIGATLFTTTWNKATSKEDETVKASVGISVPADRPVGTLLLSNTRVLTMRGHEVIEHGDILVEDNRIRAVGLHGSLRVPPGTQVIDLAGTTTLPGWIDLHYHLGLYGHQNGMHQLQAWEMLNPLFYGITTLRDPLSHTSEFYTLADRVATGKMIGPRAYSTGEAVTPNDDPDAMPPGRWTAARLQSYARRRALFDHVETLKQEGCCSDNEVPTERSYLDAAREYRLNLAVHHNLTNVRDFFPELFGGAGGVEHVLITAPWYDDVLRIFAASGITYTPTLFITHAGAGASADYLHSHTLFGDDLSKKLLPPNLLATDRKSAAGIAARISGRARYPEFVQVMTKLQQYGGHIGVGSHGNYDGVTIHAELWALAHGGMPIMNVLRAGTMEGARAIGHAKDLGSLEPGKLADLQVLAANPLDDIDNTQRIRYVMQNGRLYDVSSFIELWPEHRPIRPLEWSTEALGMKGN